MHSSPDIVTERPNERGTQYSLPNKHYRMFPEGTADTVLPLSWTRKSWPVVVRNRVLRRLAN